MAIAEQFLGDRPADLPGAGNADAHLAPLIDAGRLLGDSPPQSEHWFIVAPDHALGSRGGVNCTSKTTTAVPDGDEMTLQQLYLVLLAGGLVLLASIVAT
ncbi:MAG: hypothetical protein ACXWZI_06355, partial [Mycobacterium sp.]